MITLFHFSSASKWQLFIPYLFWILSQTVPRFGVSRRFSILSFAKAYCLNLSKRLETWLKQLFIIENTKVFSIMHIHILLGWNVMYLEIWPNNKSACRLILMVCVNWNPFHSTNINPGVKIIVPLRIVWSVRVDTPKSSLYGNELLVTDLGEFLHETFAPAKFLKNNCWLFSWTMHVGYHVQSELLLGHLFCMRKIKGFFVEKCFLFCNQS